MRKVTREEVQAKVIASIVDQLGIDEEEIGLSDTWLELGCDSLDEIELVMAAEEEFEIELPDDILWEEARLHTVSGAIDYIYELVGGE